MLPVLFTLQGSETRSGEQHKKMLSVLFRAARPAQEAKLPRRAHMRMSSPSSVIFPLENALENPTRPHRVGDAPTHLSRSLHLLPFVGVAQFLMRSLHRHDSFLPGAGHRGGGTQLSLNSACVSSALSRPRERNAACPPAALLPVSLYHRC